MNLFIGDKMNWLKIIVFVLSAMIAIGGLYLTKPEKPKLAKALSFLIIVSVIAGIVFEVKDVKIKKQQQDEVVAQNKELLGKIENLNDQNKDLITNNKKLIEYNRGLLESIVTNKYEKDLLNKYPGGYTLFGFDHLRKFESRSIPHRSDVLEEYEFDWRRVRISEETELEITIEFPNILYKPLNTNLIGTAMIIPKSQKGESYRYPPRPEGSKNRIFCELVEYKDSFYVFAIGFKHAEN
jgi:hypothetical protein